MKNLYTLIIILLALTATVKAQVSEQEFQALKALYNATGGDSWTKRTGWENINSTATKDDVTTTWIGIKTIVDGHITKIDFYDNNLAGPLPPEISNLQWLKILSIYYNKLSGQLPEEIGEMLALEQLCLSSNQLTGPLPETLGNLSNLRVFEFTGNSLNSAFPGEILQKLSKLESIYLYHCGLTGVVPDIFDSLPLFSYLDLSRNQLEGEIPQSISRLKNITTLSIGQNLFSGNLPSLDSCNLLEELSFRNNNFTGFIPDSYSNFPVLKHLYLSNNNVSGVIPAGIFRPAFQRLWIDQNLFTFEGLEPVINQLKALADQYYNTDKLFELKQNTFSVNKDEPLALNASTLSILNLGGNNNRYKWFRNNVEVYSGNSPIYIVPSASAANAGIYHFEVTSTVVTGVTLKSDNITVSIVGNNLAPTDITLSQSSVDENFTGLIGTLTSIDPDAGDTLTFILATGNGINDKDNNQFSITGNQLNLNYSANFETTPVLNIFISADDGNGGIFTKAFTIIVNNVNEAPVFKGQFTSNTIDENAINGSTVLNLTAEDPEGIPVTFSITDGNENEAFGINGNKLVVADNTKFNYDVKNSYSLTVNVSDGTLSSSATLTVSLNKINRMPDVQNATFNIDENSLVGTAVGSIVASDREDDPLVITITGGNASGAFAISGKNISVANSEPLDFETTPTFTLTINVTDGVSNVQATVVINLNNIAEPTDNAIATFLISGMVGEPEIDYLAHTVRAYVSGVFLNLLIAEFTLSSNSTSNPVSGTTFDFTSPQTITVTSQSGDQQEWVVTVTFRVEKNELNNLNVKIYPNPAIDYLHISGAQTGSLLKIVSLSGQTVYKSTLTRSDEKIPVVQLKKGMYLILLENTEGILTQKFTKE
jgi:hypothetical protein